MTTKKQNPPQPKPEEEVDDLLGDANPSEEDKAAADKAAADKAPEKAPAKPKASTKTKKVKAAQSENPAEKDKYVAPEGEEGLYHVQLDKKGYNSETGEKLFKPRVQKMTIEEFWHFNKNREGLGYEVTVLWNPEKYEGA